MKIKQTYHVCSVIFLILLTCNKIILADTVVSLAKSPDDNTLLELLLDDSSNLYYQISKGSENIIPKSRLGINTSVADFSAGLTYESASSSLIDETYTLPSGKKSTYINKCNQLTTRFTKSGKAIDVIFRVYDDGVAYQYLIGGSGEVSVISEQSECRIAGIGQVYSQVYSKDYKSIVEESDMEVLDCLEHTSLPLLVKTGNNYVLLSEAMVNGSYAASQLLVNDASQSFTYKPIGSIKSTLPLYTPWRALMIGSLNTIAESTLIENLNPATGISDLSWIKAGKATWSYGGEDTSDYLSMNNIQKYLDWTTEMGWEYFTLDRGWQNKGNIDLQKVINYANPRGIGVFIWVSQQKLPSTKNGLQNTLQAWKNQGVKGLKVDFWEDDSQAMMAKYNLLLEVAAEQKLLINFQSCTKPTGLRRTWPHLLTSEAVMGNDYYASSPAVISSVHNINSAIIRGALGSTDYKPIDFADKNGKIHQGTTWAHQLALSVAFESGVQHIQDAPNNINYNIAADFIKNLPAAWDDTKCLEAELEQYVTIARRRGEDWYLASLNNDARTIETDLSFLPSDKTYNAYIYKDGDCMSEINFEYKEGLRATDKIVLEAIQNGGFAILLSPSSSYIKPVHTKYEAESPDNVIPFGVAIRTDKDSLCSNGRYLTSIGRGRSVVFKKIAVPKSGTYAVTFYYMAAADRYAYVKVNDKAESWKEYTFRGTGAEDGGSGLGQKTIFMELDAAIENTIEFGFNNDYAPNLDRIVVFKADQTDTGIDEVDDDDNAGSIYVQDQAIIITQENAARYSIYNTLGQLVKAGTCAGGTISIPMEDTGVYVVRVSANNTVFSNKVLVK